MKQSFRFEDDMGSSSEIKAALAWRRLGAKIIALHGINEDGSCTCGNPNCQSRGKHPIPDVFPKGHLSATRIKSKIRKIFKDYPNANLGVVLPQGVVALDVDGPNGAETYKSFKLPDTLKVRTGRGQHNYFIALQELPKSKQRLENVDIKDAESGYIVVPPSTHSSGKKYRWLKTNRNVSELPAAFIESLERVDEKSARPGEETTFRSGARNTELTSIAGWCRYKGFGKDTIANTLQAINARMCKPPLNKNEVDKIAASICGYDTGFENAFGDLADVEVSEPQFLAPPYLVKGAVNVLDGNMGQGKSTFTCALAAAVTTGKPPPFVDSIEQGPVTFMSAEDDPSRILKPRLLRAGADVSAVRYQQDPFTLDHRGLAMLRAEVNAHTPKLLVIDPIIAFMREGADGNKATETMQFMHELDQIAREFDITMLIVRHLRKSRADHAMHQGIGSISISARVRSGLILAPHPNDPNKRAVAHAKSNYAKEGPTIVFEMVNDDDSSHPRLNWHQVDPDLTADDLLAQRDAERGRPPNERDAAADWLRLQLRNGAVKKRDLDVLCKEEGFSKITIRRAAEKLGVEKFKEGKLSLWTLS